MDEVIISAEWVSKIYDKGAVTALRDVTLTIRRGEYIAIMGPSGSGKSTLIHLLCGLDCPTKGRVLFEGQSPASIKEWTRVRAERIGFIFQSFNLLPTFTALENIEIAMFGVDKKPKERHQRAIELLSLVGLADRGRHRPNELSCGERQRIAIARSLANSPDVIFADEPTGNLDSKTSEQILELLGNIRKSNDITLVIISHDPKISKHASRIINIADGAISQIQENEGK
jgi:putative ABC transport system ATP-binding protein